MPPRCRPASAHAHALCSRGLTEARADIRQGVDPKLLESERSLRQRLNARGGTPDATLSDKHTEEQVATVKKEIEALTAEFQDVQRK